MDSCPLCSRPVSQEGARFTAQGLNLLFLCPQCGNYHISFMDAAAATYWSPETKLALSCAARQAYEMKQPLHITHVNGEELALPHLTTRVSENKEKLLQHIARHAPRPNQAVQISFENDFSVIDCFSSQELSWYITWLQQEALATVQAGIEKGAVGLILTAKGWEQIQPLPRPGGIRGRCFVAMWFSEDMQPAYELGIVPAVREATGKEPLRIDQKEHNNEITDEIMAEIRNAQFVVADFTGHRAGVYYEAGFAVGLGRPVIWSCRKDNLRDLHFDINHRNHIVWETPEDLNKRLYTRIRATILEPA